MEGGLMSDLISVIIPVYNAEKYLIECVTSVVKQTYKDLDIILVDDGSNDSSPIICDSFNDPRIRVFHNENKGLSFSRQFGIEHSKGAFFVSIDSDDWILPQYVEKLYESIISNHSDISICNRYDFLNDKKRIVSKNIEEGTIQIDKKIIMTNYKTICQRYGMSDSWDKMYRTSFVKNSQVSFNLPKKYNGNDLLFNYKMILHCPKISFIKEPLLMHRLTEGSMVRSSNRPILEGFELIITEIKKETKACDFSDDINSELSKVFMVLVRLSFLYCFNHSKNLKKDINNYFDELKEFISNSGFIVLEKNPDKKDFNTEIDKAFLDSKTNKMLLLAKKHRVRMFLKRKLGIF